MKKKILGIVLATAMCAGILAGCGGSDSSSASSAKSEAASSVKEESTAAASSTKEESTAAASSAAEEATELTGEGKSVTALFFSLEGEYFTLLDGWLKEGLEAKG